MHVLRNDEAYDIFNSFASSEPGVGYQEELQSMEWAISLPERRLSKVSTVAFLTATSGSFLCPERAQEKTKEGRNRKSWEKRKRG